MSSNNGVKKDLENQVKNCSLAFEGQKWKSLVGTRLRAARISAGCAFGLGHDDNVTAALVCEIREICFERFFVNIPKQEICARQGNGLESAKFNTADQKERVEALSLADHSPRNPQAVFPVPPVASHSTCCNTSQRLPLNSHNLFHWRSVFQ